MWQVWLVVSGICFIVEIITVGFLFFWFGIGALIAMIFSLFTSNIFIQSAIFLISSTILLFLTKPFVKKFLNKDSQTITGTFSIIGQTAIVTKEINTAMAQGQVRVNGEIWSAKTANNEIIPVGTNVKVLGISGVKVVVEKISETNAQESSSVTK